MEAKPFAIGFRIEHPQSLIDVARLGRFAGNPDLGAADYKLVHHAGNGRSVYSFCMCPGGTVVPATSELHRVVTNGMSHIRATSAMPCRDRCAITESRISPATAGRYRPRTAESSAYVLEAATTAQPGQLVVDFIGHRVHEARRCHAFLQAWCRLGTFGGASCLRDHRHALKLCPRFGRQIRGFDRKIRSHRCRDTHILSLCALPVMQNPCRASTSAGSTPAARRRLRVRHTFCRRRWHQGREAVARSLA